MWELLPIMRGSGYSLYECGVSLVFCHHGSAHTSAKLVGCAHKATAIIR